MLFVYYFFIQAHHFNVIVLLWFVGRRWPVVLGAAFGFGMAYGNCERALNNAIIPQDKLIQLKKNVSDISKNSSIPVVCYSHLRNDTTKLLYNYKQNSSLSLNLEENCLCCLLCCSVLSSPFNLAVLYCTSVT